jgi:hypothetical protein
VAAAIHGEERKRDALVRTIERRMVESEAAIHGEQRKGDALCTREFKNSRVN